MALAITTAGKNLICDMFFNGITGVGPTSNTHYYLTMYDGVTKVDAGDTWGRYNAVFPDPAGASNVITIPQRIFSIPSGASYDFTKLVLNAETDTEPGQIVLTLNKATLTWDYGGRFISNAIVMTFG